MIPIAVDREIELHELMIKEMGNSLKKFERKLHDVELFMHYQPDLAEDNDKEAWSDRLESLLRNDTIRSFPTLLDVKKEYKRKHAIPVVLSTGEIIDKRRDRARAEAKEARRLARAIPKASLEKLAASRKNKTFGATTGLGGKIDGEVIGIIKNYSGANTMCTNTRTLIRKHVKRPEIASTGSSLPPWIGPDTYYDEKRASTVTGIRPPTYYQQAFRSSERKGYPFKVTDSSINNSQSSPKSSHTRQWHTSTTPLAHTPHYSSDINCPNSHNTNPDDFNYFSRQSPNSTMLAKSPLSQGMKPTDTFLGPLANHPFSVGKWESDEIYDPDKKELYGTDLSTISSLNLDHVVEKMKKRERNKYKVKDYTMGGLSLRPPIPSEAEDITSRPEVQALLKSLIRVEKTENNKVNTLSKSNTVDRTARSRSGSTHSVIFPSQDTNLNIPLETTATNKNKQNEIDSNNNNNNNNNNDNNNNDIQYHNEDFLNSTNSLQNLRFDRSNYRNLQLAEEKLGYSPNCKSTQRTLSPIQRTKIIKNLKPQIDNTVEVRGLLKPGTGIDPDGIAATYSPPHSPRDTTDNERENHTTTSRGITSANTDDKSSIVSSVLWLHD